MESSVSTEENVETPSDNVDQTENLVLYWKKSRVINVLMMFLYYNFTEKCAAGHFGNPKSFEL